MLTDEHMDYLLQIRETKPPLPERTVRVMLRALFWSPEEIEHGLVFLAMPPASKDAKPPAPVDVSDPLPPAPKLQKPADIKQNPFPVGSPLITSAKQHSEVQKVKSKSHVLAGAILGLVVLIISLVIYARFARVGN